MKSKILTKEKDLQLFAEKCGKKLDLCYPISYLKKSKVRAFYNKYDAMIGGYIISFDGPFRVIESLPEEAKENSPWVCSDILDNTYEITGLWLDKKVSSKSDNFLFWSIMYKDMVFNNKKYFVYAYDLDKNYLKKLYSIVNPKVIYSGPTKLMAGMKKPCEESVEIASVNYIRFGIIYGWDYFLKKLFISRKQTKKYGITMFTKYGERVNAFNLKLPVVNKDS